MKSSNLLSRGILIGAIMALSIWFFYPLDKKIKLGLDLQGGMHLVLQVQTDDALRAHSDSDMQRLTTDAKKKGLTLAPVRAHVVDISLPRGHLPTSSRWRIR